MTKTLEQLRARYGTEAPPATVAANAVLECLFNHRTIRGFTSQKPPAGTVETAVAAGQSAATSSNLQTWSVLAVEDPERIARLSDFAGKQGFIKTAPLFLVWLADLSRLERLGQAEGQPMEGVPYLESYMVAAVDAALAAQNAVLALESIGLGTCYIGALRNNPEGVAKELGLPPLVMPIFGMCIGYPDAKYVTDIKPRLPQSVVLHREQYSTAQEAAGIASYDNAMLEFSRRNGMGDANWISRVMQRMGKLAGMSGRDAMRSYLSKLGFELR